MRYEPANWTKLFVPKALRPEPCPRTRMRHGGLPPTSTIAPSMTDGEKGPFLQHVLYGGIADEAGP